MLDVRREEWEKLPRNGDDDRWELVPALAAASDLLRRLQAQRNQIEAGETIDAIYAEDFIGDVTGMLRSYEQRWLNAHYPDGDERAVMPPILRSAAEELGRLRDWIQEHLTKGDPLA